MIEQTCEAPPTEGNVVFVSDVNVPDLDLKVLHDGPDERSAVGHPVGVAGIVFVAVPVSQPPPGCNQVWSLTQFFSYGFSQSRIGVK